MSMTHIIFTLIKALSDALCPVDEGILEEIASIRLHFKSIQFIYIFVRSQYTLQCKANSFIETTQKTPL